MENTEKRPTQEQMDFVRKLSDFMMDTEFYNAEEETELVIDFINRKMPKSFDFCHKFEHKYQFYKCEKQCYECKSRP